MGLFGGILRGLGKVVGGAARAVASQATGGLSEKAISAFKSAGRAKSLAAANIDGYKAKTMQTYATLNKRLGPVRAYDPKSEAFNPSLARSAARLARKRVAERKEASLVAEGLDIAGVAQKKGLLDLKAMSREWNNAGKLGPDGKAISWQNWIRLYPIYTLSQ